MIWLWLLVGFAAGSALTALTFIAVVAVDKVSRDELEAQYDERRAQIKREWYD